MASIETLGAIRSIEEVRGMKLPFVSPGGRNSGTLGVLQMIRALGDVSSMDGYKVVTDRHEFHVLIDNGQNCCESWGYLSSEDDLAYFVGSDLLGVNLTDVARNQSKVAASGWYDGDQGGIQFVDFVTSKGVLQLAVYNAHNGYYGHGILVLRDRDILFDETL